MSLTTWPLRPWSEWALTNATIDDVRQAIDWQAGGVGVSPWVRPVSLARSGTSAPRRPRSRCGAARPSQDHAQT